jgi:hypothetical protein
VDPTVLAQLILLLEPEAQALILLVVKLLHRNQPIVVLPFPDAGTTTTTTTTTAPVP